MINYLICDLNESEVYIDDVIVYSDIFEEYLLYIWVLFVKLLDVNLIVSFVKIEFCYVIVEYFGYVVGNGYVKFVFVKVDVIVKFLVL